MPLPLWHALSPGRLQVCPECVAAFIVLAFSSGPPVPQAPARGTSGFLLPFSQVPAVERGHIVDWMIIRFEA